MNDIRLNFNVLKGLGLSAVKCKNSEQAQILLDEMRRQYPELLEKYWKNTGHRWRQYAPNTTYALHIFDRKIDTMQIADEKYWLDHKYFVVQFEDLMYTSVDYGEFDTNIGNIESLFGFGG